MTVLGEICGLSEFLDGIHTIMFEVTSDKQSRYQWIRSTNVGEVLLHHPEKAGKYLVCFRMDPTLVRAGELISKARS